MADYVDTDEYVENEQQPKCALVIIIDVSLISTV